MLPPRPLRGSGKVAQTAFSSKRRDGKSCIPRIRLLLICESEKFQNFILLELLLEREVAAWEAHRNKHHAKADWQFTTADARGKLKRLYPQF